LSIEYLSPAESKISCQEAQVSYAIRDNDVFHILKFTREPN